VVSVVLVNFRGADDTLEAIGHLAGLDWPTDRLEIVVVENGSGDDSASRLRDAAPHVNLVLSRTNEGFAGGCNLGVAASSGEFIALLNNDARPDPGWVRAAMEKFDQSDKIGAVASRVLDWEGNLVDYIGSAMTWYGMGYKPFTAEPIPHNYSAPGDVLFGTGSAMFVRRVVFDELGGFDERYFMFFEDVDLGWRLNLRGWRFAYEPRSLAYHKHHASMASFGSHKETYLLERNALFTLYKNIGEQSHSDSLAGAIALSMRRAVTRAELDSTSFDLRKPSTDTDPQISVSRQAISALFAVDQFVENLPSLATTREEIQKTRVVSDAVLWKLFGVSDAAVGDDRRYVAGYEKIVNSFDVADGPIGQRVLVITGDPIGRKLAGPGIRAWNMALTMSRTSEVALVSLSGVEPMDAPFAVEHIRLGDHRGMARWEAWADVIVFQGEAMALFRVLRRTSKVVVVDVYDPTHLEQLEQGKELGGAQWARQVTHATEILNDQLIRGDFFLCASDRQRPFWLGQLAGLGRLNPATYEDDPDLRGLIDVVPFGLSSSPPRHERDVLKGVLPGITADDKIILWGGGLYNWFDPKTLIRAVADLATRRDNVRLFFQGTKHPHPFVPEMSIVAESRELAEELGVLGRSVFFNDSWVDYEDRQNYLTEADAGVSTHFNHIETEFSFRTRILDYLWAGLPMVVTEGDHFAGLVERENLGVVVAAEDVLGLSRALERVLFDEEFAAIARDNIARVRQEYYWSEVLRPLTRFIANPRRARDDTFRASASAPARTRLRRKRHGFRHDLRLTIHYLRNGGPGVVIRKIRGRLQR
jgi:GT2 family glycosyltransferase/glycosyltransferase involved in cell wall biosynthesis